MSTGKREKRSRGQGEGREKSDLLESVVQIRRCAAVVKGGRRFSFNALVVVGDRKGRVGIGYGRAKEVPPAVEKAVKDAHKHLMSVRMQGTTLPHKVIGRFGSSRVVMLPASPGTGVIAGRGVRDIMVAAGITDVLTKCLGSTNPCNVVKATINGFKALRTRAYVEQLRGVKI